MSLVVHAVLPRSRPALSSRAVLPRCPHAAELRAVLPPRSNTVLPPSRAVCPPSSEQLYPPVFTAKLAAAQLLSTGDGNVLTVKTELLNKHQQLKQKPSLRPRIRLVLVFPHVMTHPYFGRPFS